MFFFGSGCPYTQVACRVERGKYDLGKGTITDVLDTQSALIDSETNHAKALAEYNTAIAQYQAAVGEYRGT